MSTHHRSGGKPGTSSGSASTLHSGSGSRPAPVATSSAAPNGIIPPPSGIPGASPRVTKYNNTADVGAGTPVQAAPVTAPGAATSQAGVGGCPIAKPTAAAASSPQAAQQQDNRKGSMMMSGSQAAMRTPSMVGVSTGAGSDMTMPIHFQCEMDPDDPISAWKLAMDDTAQRMYTQLRNDVERMESNINVGEQEVHGKEEEQFFNRADEMEVNNLLKRQMDEIARLEAAFVELFTERKVRKAGKLTNKRSYKEAKTRYIKIKHQEKVKQTADAVLEASEQHRRRLDQLLQLVESKHRRQRDNLLVSQERRIKSQRAVLDLELTNVKNDLLREEVVFDWETKLAHQKNADKLAADQLRDTQQAELTHRKERFETESKSMAEIAAVNIDQLREMGELEHKQKLEMILLTDALEHAREKVQLLRLTGLKHVELRKLKATHKGQLVQLVKQHKNMSSARQKKWRDGLGAELLKLAELNSEASASDSSMVSGKGLARDDSRSSVGSAESGMTGLTGISGLSGMQSNEGGVAETVTSDDTEAEVKAAEEAVQQLMSEEYGKANALWTQMQDNQKNMHARQKEDRRKLAYAHRDNMRATELAIKTRYEEMDLAHESERRDLRKSHDTAMSELVQFMHKEYLVNKSIRLADRKSLAERRLLGSVLNTVVDAVVSISPNGLITRFNLAAEKMFGYKAEEIIGQNVKIITPVAHAWKHDGYLKHYLKTGQRKIIGTGRQDFARRKDGSEFPVFLNLSRCAKKDRSCSSRILPASIADQLMNGEPVTPRTFTDVTVLYTDLVGFTEISSGLAPSRSRPLAMRTCALLGARPNGNNHVKEIAKLALHLMKAVSSIKMPRYCLFGDTVTIANKMESAGVPMKIQLSDPTYRRLEKMGGFSCEARGDVIVPGKGTFKAYFLKDMEGFTPEFPIPGKAKTAAAGAVAPPIVTVAPPLDVAAEQNAATSPVVTDELEQHPKDLSLVGAGLGMDGVNLTTADEQLDDSGSQGEEESAFSFGLGKVSEQQDSSSVLIQPEQAADAPQQPGI
ncbi:hypothetical protein BCR44DRAFT_1495893 [Catenaria anguillulae PL171]|uniref:PAS domain-containing protein n=1 Tax=Catenaria anguillulae PL171 TaxID=765915 RepID=A0A1Y2I2U8_9FUNG|nr:hypothetical protein BCR44DRAFT_1495893 [Catenaria anguillulae PL171]